MTMSTSDSAVSLPKLVHVPTEVKLPRGAKLADYDLAQEDDQEIWSMNKLKMLKGRATLIAELKAQADSDEKAYELWLEEAKRRQAEGTLSDMEELSDLEEEQQPRRKRQKAEAQAATAEYVWTGSAEFNIGCGLYSTQWLSGEDSKYTGSVLPLPIHYGHALLEQERDFDLPVPMLRNRARLLANAAPTVLPHIHDLLPEGKRPPPFERIRASACAGIAAL